MTGPAPRPRPPEGASFTFERGRMQMPVLLASFPPEVPFGFLGRVLPTSEELGLDLELHPIGAEEAMAMLESSEAVARAELERGESARGGRSAELALEAESAAEFGRSVAGRRQELYRVGLTVRSSGSSRAGAEAGRSRLMRRLESLGFRVRLPRYEAALALAPPRFAGGERRPPGYWHTLSTDSQGAIPCSWWRRSTI